MEKLCAGAGEGSPPSFSSMIQEPKCQLKASPERRSPSSESNFEFGRVNWSPPSPADVLFSKGQLIPTNSSPNSSSSRRASNSSGSDRSRNSTGGIKSCLRDSSRNSERRRRSTEAGVPKRVSFQALPAEQKPSRSRQGRNTARRSAPAPARAARKVGNMATKRGNDKKQGLFGSFLLVCRECHALEPSKHVSERIIAI